MDPKIFNNAVPVSILGMNKNPVAGLENASDVMLIGFFTGMRVEEICHLKVRDCRTGWFTIRDAKSEAEQRRDPIHTKLVAVVERRIEDKSDNEFLIHETKEDAATGRRSPDIMKQFYRHRDHAGADHRIEGRRGSLTDFHSLRRTFTTKAFQADINQDHC